MNDTDIKFLSESIDFAQERIERGDDSNAVFNQLREALLTISED